MRRAGRNADRPLARGAAMPARPAGALPAQRAEHDRLDLIVASIDTEAY